MVYVRKDLADMLEVVGLPPQSQPSQSDHITHPEAIMSYNSEFWRIVQDNVPNTDDQWELYNNSGRGGVWDHLGSNAFRYAYWNKLDPNLDVQMTVDYYFAERGFVMQVQDNGVGFDAEREMKIFLGELEDHRRITNLGEGLAYFGRERIQAHIESSQADPTGTTFTFAYIYSNQ